MKQCHSACTVAGLEVARSEFVILVRAVVFDNVDGPDVLTQMLVVRAAPLGAAINKGGNRVAVAGLYAERARHQNAD